MSGKTLFPFRRLHARHGSRVVVANECEFMYLIQTIREKFPEAAEYLEKNNQFLVTPVTIHET